ncbi:hypothetical protein [Microbacterium alcoholitolerans]
MDQAIRSDQADFAGIVLIPADRLFSDARMPASDPIAAARRGGRP